MARPMPGPMPVPPPGMAPGAPPGMMPGMMGPMAPPIAPPVQPPSAFTDLSADLPVGWQLIDVMIRTGNDAIATGQFRRTPAVAAALQSVISQLSRLLSAYSSGGAPEGATPAESERGALGGEPPINDTGLGDEAE